MWLQADPDFTGMALIARLQSEHPDRFTEGQLRTMQRRVQEWRGIMANKLVCTETGQSSTEPNGQPELALIGAVSKCCSFGNIFRTNRRYSTGAAGAVWRPAGMLFRTGQADSGSPTDQVRTLTKWGF